MNRSKFFMPLFAAMFLLEINDNQPEGGSPNPEMEASDESIEGEDDATTGVNAIEQDDEAPEVSAEPGVDTTEQSADGE